MIELLDLFFCLGLLTDRHYHRLHGRLGRYHNPGHLLAVLARICRLEPARARWLLRRQPAEVLALIESYRLVDDRWRDHVLREGRRCRSLEQLARLLIGGGYLTEAEALRLFTLSPDAPFTELLVPLDEFRPGGPDPRLLGPRQRAALLGDDALLQTLRRLCAEGLLTDWQARALLLGRQADLSLGNGLYLLEPCGRGGVGQVYRARHAPTWRECAVKVLRPDHRQTLGEAELRAWRQRWWHEARIQAELDRHPRVARVHGAGLDPTTGDAYIEMEFIPGRSLAQVVHEQARAGRRLSAALVCRLGLQILDALGHMHARGLVCRDLKPGNVMWRMPAGLAAGELPDEPDAILIDYGFARRFRDSTGLPLDCSTDTWVGTDRYRAPELPLGTPASVRSDLFSFGRTLLSLLHGTPEPADDAFRTDLPPSLARLLAELTADAPILRPIDCADAAAALERALLELSGQATLTDRQTTVMVPAAGQWLDAESIQARPAETVLEANEERTLLPGRSYGLRADSVQPAGEQPERLGVLLREPTFQRLTLEGCRWADDDCLATMLHIYLRDTDFCDMQAPGLLALDLSHTPITDRTLEHLPRLRHLRSLWLRGCRITDEGLRHLVGLAHLEELRLSGVPGLTAQALAIIAQVAPKLDLLEVGGAAGSDDALLHLAGTGIRHLRVRNATVTRNGLRALENCRSLRCFEFQGRRAFSDADCERLSRRLRRREGRMVVDGELLC